jgi:hypothetical protein
MIMASLSESIHKGEFQSLVSFPQLIIGLDSFVCSLIYQFIWCLMYSGHYAGTGYKEQSRFK